VEFFEHRLPNGLQIVAERNPHVHSVAVGFFVRTGARDETDEVLGVSHFLEHMAFKGTAKHSADDVNRVFDEVGAKYNASTSEETTLFYAAILPEYLPRTFELLADILFPALREDDFNMEKKVILEEIGMYDDQPGFLVYEKAMEAHFKGHPLGRSILGSNESITALAVDRMREYHRRRYNGGNIVLAVAGNFDWPDVVALAQRWCGDWPAGSPERATPVWAGSGGLDLLVRPSSVQEHVMSLCEGPSATDPLRHAAELISVVVGDDTGSRMFWDLVDPGLVESADLGFNDFDGTGVFMTYLCGTPEDTDENLGRIRSILDDVNRGTITAAELDQAKNKVLSRIVLRSERPMGRLGSLGHNWLCRGEYRPVEADLDRYKSVTLEEVRECLARFPLGARTSAAIGPCEKVTV
jgi:predicted Zn-dependent peptidase